MTYKQANLNRRPDEPGLDKKQVVGALAFLGGAALIAIAFGAGALHGWAAGKFTEPGETDLENLEKEHALARMRADNRIQQVDAQREQAEREMREQDRKRTSMRIG